MEKIKTTAIILSGGKGTRLGASIPKQYIEVNGKPILYYTIRAFEESTVDEIIIAVSEDYREYVEQEIVKKYNFKKVTGYVIGGEERYDSVYNALKYVNSADFVVIHDGARPFVSSIIIEKSINDAFIYGASVAGVPSKDTVKMRNEEGFCTDTPDRKNVWIIQTPQTFEYKLIWDAYSKQNELCDKTVTDDAMVVEKYTKVPVHIFESSYNNIKITTREDLDIANMLLK